MAGPLLGNFLLHRLRFYNSQRFIAQGVAAQHRHRHWLWCSTTASFSPSEQENENTSSVINAHYSNPAQCKDSRLDAPDYQWKDEEEKILSDIESMVMLAKCIIHSSKYNDWERLTDEDEKAVVEKLLVYHPDYEDKIGCGLESITVGRHPEFGQHRYSRCLLVVRTNGVWTDFSYHECLRQYIREKYPTNAERFIKVHFNGRKFLHERFKRGNSWHYWNSITNNM